MSQPASLGWFARHEFRLLWRDWISLWTGGKRSREWILGIVAVVLIGVIHSFAYLIVTPLTENGIAIDKTTLVVVTSSAFLSWTMMVAQVMESVTRAFYARADLDLILSSPTSARRVFAVRMLAIVFSTAILTTVMAGPFINLLIINDGPRWFAAYGVILSMGAMATALAVTLTVVLFRALGPQRTRLISQIVAAVVGAAFVIGVQAVAVISTGTLSRLSILSSEGFVALAPDIASWFWLPARAAMGDLGALALIFTLSFGLLALVIESFAASFGDHVIAATGTAYRENRVRAPRRAFQVMTPKATLRRKEWTLLRRDPWLISQTLMQILYLIPPAVLLWVNFGVNVDALLIIVPVLVMGAGQLAGGLAWLAVSGEDAPDLVASAPVRPRAVVRAKIEAVVGSVILVVGPLIFFLALAAPRLAAVAAVFLLLSAGSGTLIQIWYRGQARRSDFRRRQISSRVATLSEALSSILWAGTAALAAAGSWFAIATAVMVLITLLVAWIIRPRREGNG